MHARHILIYIIAALSFITDCRALRAEHFYYKGISLSEGLSATVQSVLTDSRGVVWIGTRNGLATYDGHELRHYHHRSDRTHSLPHNNIIQIAEDNLHNIWILTEKGVVRYLHEHNGFEPVKDEKGERVVAYSTHQSAQGLLFGARSRLLRYCPDTEMFHTVATLPGEKSYHISHLTAWNSHTLLCGDRWHGLWLIDLQTGESRRPPFDCGKEIRSMTTDHKGRIWIAPYNHGLLCYSQQGKLLAQYTTANSSLSHNVILTIIEKDGKIWLGTDGGGISILDPELRQFTHLTHTPGDNNYSLPANSVLCLYNDSNNNLWAGSIRNGLINIRSVYMKTYTDALPGSTQGLSNKTVLSLLQADNNRVWVGTDGGGINLFNPAKEEFTHYPTTQTDKITSIASAGQGQLMLSLFAQGICLFDTRSGRKTPFTVVDAQTNARLCRRGKSVNLLNDSPGTVLILGEQIYRYDIGRRTFDSIPINGQEKMNGTSIPIAVEDDRIFLHDTKTIYQLRREGSRLHTLFKVRRDTLINSVSRDEAGNFWIGSNYGLIRFNSFTRQRHLLPTSLFTNVSSVVCDGKGNVWIGAENMLLAWRLEEEKFVLMGESDGVMPNEYLPKPRLVTPQGDILMGGAQGLLKIDNAHILPPAATPRMHLSEVSVNGEGIDLHADGSQEGTVRKVDVPWKGNITIQTMLNEPDLFRKKIYRYRIEGLDNQPIRSFTPQLTLRSLPAKEYTIYMSCTAKDGSWIPEQALLTFTVLPPWYRTWWFIGSCLLLISAVIIEAFRRALRRKEEKMKWAMQEHEQKVYEEKVRFLINISHELRTPLTLIYAPLHRILKSLPAGSEHFSSLKAVYRQAQRMKDIINMVLDLRKMEVSEHKLQARPVQLNQWIKEIADDFLTEAEAKHINLKYRLDNAVATADIDPNKCHIIMSNLLINAIKHSPQGSSITISTRLKADGQRVVVSIADQGCGLQEAEIGKLFTRFYQGSGEQGGSGIGLSYAKILTELHQGTIGASNNGDGGATFFIEIPVRQEADGKVEKRAYLNELEMSDAEIAQTDTAGQTGSPGAFDTTQCTIVIVDDNSDLTTFLSESLSCYFKKTLTAPNGEEALRLIRSHHPDIVISDVMMPRMNGYDLCRAIKEDIDISHIPVVLLTARGDNQSQISGYKNGADAYLTKPFEVETLMALIINRLKERTATRQRYLQAGILPAPEESTISQTDEQFLLKLNRIIQENLEDTRLDIPFLSKEMGMSRASLYNKVKALTDMGASEYINKIKMERATELLKATDLTMTEIAERLGFSSSRYFSTAFKQYTGTTPTLYKKEHR